MRDSGSCDQGSNPCRAIRVILCFHIFSHAPRPCDICQISYLLNIWTCSFSRKVPYPSHRAYFNANPAWRPIFIPQIARSLLRNSSYPKVEGTPPSLVSRPQDNFPHTIDSGCRYLCLLWDQPRSLPK